MNSQSDEGLLAQIEELRRKADEQLDVAAAAHQEFMRLVELMAELISNITQISTDAERPPKKPKKRNSKS